MSESDSTRAGVLRSVSTWLQLLALIVLAAEAVLLFALSKAPESDPLRPWYVPLMLSFLGLVVIGLFFDRYLQQRYKALQPEPREPLLDTTEANVISPSPGRTLRIKLAEGLSPVSRNLSGQPTDTIIPLIKHQIHVHRFVFSYPNPSAYIPIGGRYFGRFSWDNEVVICHEIIEIADDVEDDYWRTWSAMQATYVEAYSAPHRQPDGEPTEQSLTDLKKKLEWIVEWTQELMEAHDLPDRHVLMALLAKIEAILKSLDLHDRSKTPTNAVVQLEMALSTAHDIIRRTTPKASEP